MADLLLHVGAQVMCMHAGTATDSSPNTRVRVGGMAVATLADSFTIAGCTWTIPGTTKPQPCVKITWLAPATRVRIGGSPALLRASAALCQSAEQIPQGAPLVLSTQIRVRGM